MVRVKQENIPDHQYFHNSSQGVTIFRILLSACAHCRQNRCFNSPRRLTGRRNSPRRLARFEKGVLDVAHGDLRWWTLFMISKKRGDSLSTSFNCLFCKVVPQEIGLMADTKIISQLCNRMRHRCHNAPSDPVFTTSAKLSNLKWLVVMTPTDFPNISMNFQDDIAQFVQDRGRVRMGQVSWWWASRLVLQLWIWETSICLTLRTVPIGNCRWMRGFNN